MMQSVQVIIERLKTHPEDFFGDIDENKSLAIKHPKFYDIATKLDDLLRRNNDGIDRLWFLEPEEREALLAAYTEAHRARFESKVFHTLLTKPEEYIGVALQTRSHPVSGKVLMQGAQGAMWSGAVPKAEGGPV